MSAANIETHPAKHPYHLVDPSPWPIVGALAALALTSGGVMYMHQLTVLGIPGAVILGLGGVLTLATMFFWWRDVVREGEFQGHHTRVVQIGLRYGMALFIASEVMFFAAFFWAYFDNALFPDGGTTASGLIEQVTREKVFGGVWPPKGVTVFSPWSVPFLNTLILLTSGVTVTWAHHELREGNRRAFLQGLALTIVLGVCFTSLQAYEYSSAPFSFRMVLEDGNLLKGGSYSSTFFMATGFHGFHVIIGTIFLSVCFVRGALGHFTPDHHFGLEAAAWYWHFVDVVWLFLFTCIYWIGSGNAPLHH
jgi:cytochrome c oxidase subunit 3